MEFTTLLEIFIPILLLAVGITFAIFPHQAGLFFCKSGKAIWRISTFGLTDMHWFYREDKAASVGRRLGIVMTLFGVLFGILAIASFSGPNSFAAMREAEIFLKHTYGGSSGWSLSCSNSSDGSNDVVVQYKYSNRKGNLHGIWNGKHYVFTEVH